MGISCGTNVFNVRMIRLFIPLAAEEASYCLDSLVGYKLKADLFHLLLNPINAANKPEVLLDKPLRHTFMSTLLNWYCDIICSKLNNYRYNIRLFWYLSVLMGNLKAADPSPIIFLTIDLFCFQQWPSGELKYNRDRFSQGDRYPLRELFTGQSPPRL